MRRLILLLLVLLLTPLAWATHQRAGEISFEHVSGLTYRFKIITYTYTPSLADRDELEVKWGDGSSSIVRRTQKVNLANDISVNTYLAEHTFPSTGEYSITMEDPNRNAGIVNIPNSVNIPFFLETTLVINPFLGSNHSPQLLNPPIDDGCVGVPYYHNPGAYDPDGDSLSYHLIDCRGYEGENIPGYTLPRASQSISINPVTGDLTWDSPTAQGEYNIAILIKEWRHGVMIGSMVRDMQIHIVACNNVPPTLTTLDDTCITAGETLRFAVTASDENSSSVTLTATGGIFQLPESPATFGTFQGHPPFTTTLSWSTTCAHVKLQPYSVLFKAVDNGPQVPLTAYKTVNITVVAPAPHMHNVEPIGNAMHVSWHPHECNNITGYRIYRKADESDYQPAPCETGLPAHTGYQLIGTNFGHNDTLFVDDGAQLPLNHGITYCYRIVAFFDDGAESYASDELCALLRQDVPCITHVDIEHTDSIEGSLFLRWLSPLELDTLRFPGPHYEYRIFRSLSPYFSDNDCIDTLYALTDTTYLDQHLNTRDLTYYYRIELWTMIADSLVKVGHSDPASSVFLEVEEHDRALHLQWNESVPWLNHHYIVARYDETIHQFITLDTIQQQHYIDAGLVNGRTYCYRITAMGQYAAMAHRDTLLNRSQRSCATPRDDQPPAVPATTVSTDCKQITLQWHFDNDSAYLDVAQYFVYYRPNSDAPYMVIDSFTMTDDCYLTDCNYTLTDLPYIIGCFTIGAVDTAGNYSDYAEETCFDWELCDSYHLPNVFTPNNDGVNDIFHPFPYDNVQRVEFYLYNRWGQLIFKTEDPDIMWDGTDMHTGRPSSDGTYFYACKVYLYALSGIVSKDLHGTLTLLR